MKPNIGGADIGLRIVLGVALLSLYFVLEGSARWFGLIGIVPIATALLRWCPAYVILGISTCPAHRDDA
jgi:hypothetical protein